MTCVCQVALVQRAPSSSSRACGARTSAALGPAQTYELSSIGNGPSILFRVLGKLSQQKAGMAAHILVVEDEPAIQELITINLEHAGFVPVRADSAERAFEIV